MKNQTIRNLTVALLAAVSAFAQESDKLLVQIPFNFHVGERQMQAGLYTVDTLASQLVVRLRSNSDHSAAMILSNGIAKPDRIKDSRLIFNRYGDQYFLSEVWSATASNGRSLLKTKLESHEAASARRAVESVLASR